MILIRADANEIIGTGHVMRCLSIAYALAMRGKEVLFVTADHRADSLIKRQGFKNIVLDTKWLQLDTEIQQLKIMIKRYKAKAFIVDSYYVTQRYFLELAGNVNIIYIDDINLRPWNVNALINYNIFAEDYDYSAYLKLNTRMLLGPQYTPLRNEFHNLHRHQIKEKITDILISTGGADPEKLTERMIYSGLFREDGITFHIVVGLMNPRLPYIKEILPPNAILHVNEQRMAELMMKCDLAVSAAGSTLYELCACGTPTITYVLADNQRTAAGTFESHRLMINVGDCRNRNSFMDELKQKIRMLSSDYVARRDYSKAMRRAIDGLGASRIAEALIQSDN